MSEFRPVFIADSCIGGLSVLHSMWRSGAAYDAVFLADYAINPLGTKSDSKIAEVASQWLSAAAHHSDTLIIACNTLSIRYHQLCGPNESKPGLKQVVSMVDCFREMIETEMERLENTKVLVIGTAFTASQSLYPEMLKSTVPGVQVAATGATELERNIARFQPRALGGSSLVAGDLRQAIEAADVAVLACTCFPMVRTELEALFPKVVFLDPGDYSSGLLRGREFTQDRRLDFIVTGTEVAEARVAEFAQGYLPGGFTALVESS